MNPDLDPEVLAHLAHLARQRRRQWAGRIADTGATAEALAELLVAGERPALGWWRNQLAPRMPSEAPVRPSEPRNTPWEYVDLVQAAEDYAELHLSKTTALEVLAEITLLGGLGAQSLRTAFELYEELSDDPAALRGPPDRGSGPFPDRTAEPTDDGHGLGEDRPARLASGSDPGRLAEAGSEDRRGADVVPGEDARLRWGAGEREIVAGSVPDSSGADGGEQMPLSGL